MFLPIFMTVCVVLMLLMAVDVTILGIRLDREMKRERDKRR